MGITFKEFLVAMETFGAEKIHQLDVENGVSLPAFFANDVIFVHCGDYCKILNIKNSPRAEKLLNEKIRSISSLFIILLILEEKYDEKLLHNLINQAYNELFKELKIKNNDIIHCDGNKFIGYYNLYKSLLKFDNIVNPYGNDTLRLEEPYKYLDKLKIGLYIEDDMKSNYQNVNISLVNDRTKIGFVNNKNGWYYYASTFNDLSIGKDSGYTAISHYFNNGNDGLLIDEVVNLNYVSSKDDFKLSISLKYGLAWNSDNIKDMKPVKNIQVDCMIYHLERCICRVKEDILNHMCI